MPQKKNIALLTGRGGSVSIRNKNVMPVLGRPLMLYPYLAAYHSKLIDDIYLSTDGEHLKEVANRHNIKVIERPPELAGPTSQHVDCIQHALGFFDSEGVDVNILVVLLCNVPTHDIGAIDRAICFLEEHTEFDSCVAVSEMQENHPEIAKKAISGPIPLIKSFENDVHYISPFQDGKLLTPRETMIPSFFLTHSFWALRVDNGLKRGGQPPWDFLGDRVAGLTMDQGRDIHDFEDSAFSECWLQMRGWSPVYTPFD
jgi:CMP-N,N'-diacetyllegionaminic acid synthase